MNVLVTGGTGHLGSAIVTRLDRDGHQVRVLARSPGSAPGIIEWVQGDLATGEGVREAVGGVEVVVHAATNSPAARRGRFRLGDFVRSPADVDVDGTSALLAAAEGERVAHFVHVSIVGLEHLRRLPYARRKLQAEQLVRASGVPWSIVRATTFYWLLDRLCHSMLDQRIIALPGHARMAPGDADEFADHVVAAVADGPAGDRPDFAGPEDLTLVELLEQYLAARGSTRRIRRVPLPARMQAAITAGGTSATARRGATRWADWLAR
jgi:uncharacterized protein YbjT (DUF2867 family)